MLVFLKQVSLKIYNNFYEIVLVKVKSINLVYNTKKLFFKKKMENMSRASLTMCNSCVKQVIPKNLKKFKKKLKFFFFWLFNFLPIFWRHFVAKAKADLMWIWQHVNWFIEKSLVFLKRHWKFVMLTSMLWILYMSLDLIIAMINLLYHFCFREFTSNAACAFYDEPHARVLSKFLYGDGPTPDQVRMEKILSSNSKYLVLWYLAAWRIHLFHFGSWKEEKLIEVMWNIDSPLVFSIEETALLHFTDFNEDWMPPVDYLEWPIQKMAWMDYGPSLLLYRNYEPLNSIFWYAGCGFLMYWGAPIVKESMGEYVKLMKPDTDEEDDSSGEQDTQNRRGDNQLDDLDYDDQDLFGGGDEDN